ncbi:MAG: hypothetical protein GQ574_17715 [Crocinitomix sp.]|nr:hypothetical protein [Crocinitomix sp.]
MKKTLTLCLFIFTLVSTHAQITKELIVAGVAENIENAMLAGDQISFNGPSSQSNLHLKITSDKGNKTFHACVDPIINANGHYSFERIIKVKENSKITFEGELEVFVWMETIFGNKLWTKVTRTKDNITDPITLDHYNHEKDERYAALNTFRITCSGIPYDADLKAKLKANNNDEFVNADREDFHIYLKNKGDAKWKIDELNKTGAKTKTSVKALVQNTGVLDLKKTIVLRVELTTKNGNILWDEIEVEAQAMSTPIWGVNYKIIETTESEEEETEVEETEEVPPVDETNNDEKVEEINTAAEVEETERVNVSTDKVNVNTVTAKTIDLTTKTPKAFCTEMTKGDTVITVSGSSICVNSPKPAGSKAKTATLGADCNFEVGGVVFPIKSNETIMYNLANGALLQGVLRANVTYTTTIGDIVLKEGSIVVFKADKLIGGSLAENATLKIGNTTLECTPNGALDNDIRFDNKGRLMECTIANDLEWKTDIALTFPKMSRLKFKNERLDKVVSIATTSFVLNGKTVNVQGHKITSAYAFNSDGQLEMVISGSSNTIDIEGQSVPIEEGSKITLAIEEGYTVIAKVFAAETVTIKVYKGKSVKETTVKAGKKIVIENGIVVKAG